jgi:hypothetical protein
LARRARSPVDIDDVGHAAAFERLRRQARPEDYAVGQRVAGGDTERERVGIEDRLGENVARQQRRRDRRGPEDPAESHQLTTRHPGQRTVVDGHGAGIIRIWP